MTASALGCCLNARAACSCRSTKCAASRNALAAIIVAHENQEMRRRLVLMRVRDALKGSRHKERERHFKGVDVLKSTLSALVEKKILQAIAVTNATAETTTRTEPLLHRQRYRLRRKIRFTLRRITSMIRDMHHKVSSWLPANYHEVVLLPASQTSAMARKSNQSAAADGAAAIWPAGARRKLLSPSVRATMALSHFRFENLLKYKMERSGARVIKCSEEGVHFEDVVKMRNVKYDVRASTTYKCHSCRLTQDRDINAMLAP